MSSKERNNLKIFWGCLRLKRKESKMNKKEFIKEFLGFCFLCFLGYVLLIMAFLF